MTTPERTCATCAHFEPPPSDVVSAAGTCRASPPVTHYTWPKVMPDGWCARWTARTSVPRCPRPDKPDAAARARKPKVAADPERAPSEPPLNLAAILTSDQPNDNDDTPDAH